MNLLQETLQDIEESGHTTTDVLWVGSDDGEYQISWDEFAKIADVDYDNGYGIAGIVQDLVVVFADGGHLFRGEYDGSEWWAFDSTPPLNPRAKSFSRVLAELSEEHNYNYAHTLKEANNG